MLLAKLLSKIFSKKNGIILIDSEGQKYICGTPNLNNPLIKNTIERKNLAKSSIIDVKKPI